MALVSITEAAKLVRRNRSTLYRDIERGRLSKTITPEGETQIDTAELLRAYGRLYSGDEENGDDAAQARTRIAILEERTRSLERALQLEAELRRVKDQVTNELRARLADKDNVIKVLESKVLFLEYDKEVEALQPERKDKESKEARAPQETLAEQQSRAQAVLVERAASDVVQTSAQEPVKPAPMTNENEPLTFAEPVKPAEPLKAVEPVKFADPLKPSKPTKSVDPLEPTESTTFAEPLKPSEPVKSAEPLRSAEPIKPPEPGKPRSEGNAVKVMPRKGWWARFLNRR